MIQLFDPQIRHLYWSETELRHTRTKTYIFLALMIVLGPMANVFFKAGMKNVGALSIGSLALLPSYLAHVFASPSIWLGIIARVSFTIVYMLLLSWADYSYVTPVSAISHGLVAVMGFLLLGETVTTTRWIGVAIICLGVGVVGSTPVRTTEPAFNISDSESIEAEVEPVLEHSSRT